jgi:hypothetical protein
MEVERYHPLDAAARTAGGDMIEVFLAGLVTGWLLAMLRILLGQYLGNRRNK